jgi:hypothetical protein
MPIYDFSARLGTGEERHLADYRDKCEKAPNNDPGANQVQRVDFLVISYPNQGSRSAPIVTPSGCWFAQRNHRLGDFLQEVMVRSVFTPMGLRWPIMDASHTSRFPGVLAS